MRNWTPEDIKELRARHDLSQPAFGDLLGVTGNYIYLIEKGVKKPGKSLRLLVDCVEKQLNENGKGKEKVKHGKRHLQAPQ